MHIQNQVTDIYISGLCSDQYAAAKEAAMALGTSKKNNKITLISKILFPLFLGI